MGLKLCLSSHRRRARKEVKGDFARLEYTGERFAFGDPLAVLTKSKLR